VIWDFPVLEEIFDASAAPQDFIAVRIKQSELTTIRSFLQRVCCWRDWIRATRRARSVPILEVACDCMINLVTDLRYSNYP
jgi:hypothetical protein